MRFPLSMPSLGTEEHKYVSEALRDGWISGSGKYVDSFEAALCRVVARNFAIATSSGTSAIEVVLRALDIGPADEVIVPALTFASPATAVVRSGATPVLCEISPEHWTIDPRCASRLVTNRTRAIIAVDLMGHPCEFDQLESLGVPIIEDAAEAHGASIGSRKTGSFGLASIFSFHANKAISTGEGGAILTDDEDLAAKCRVVASHGMRPDRPYYHNVLGQNAKMTNVTAAIGLAQAERWSELTKARTGVELQYRNLLTPLRVESRPIADWATYSTWLTCVLSEDPEAIVRIGRSAGIDCRRVWPPIPASKVFERFSSGPYPVAEMVSRHALWLPTWSHMDNSSIEEIVRSLWG